MKEREKSPSLPLAQSTVVCQKSGGDSGTLPTVMSKLPEQNATTSSRLHGGAGKTRQALSFMQPVVTGSHPGASGE